MALKDKILYLLEEYRERGIKEMPLREFVKQAVVELGTYPQTVYNIVKLLEWEGKIKIIGNKRNKKIILQ